MATGELVGVFVIGTVIIGERVGVLVVMMTSTTGWSMGLKVIEGLIDELEAMDGKDSDGKKSAEA